MTFSYLPIHRSILLLTPMTHQSMGIKVDLLLLPYQTNHRIISIRGPNIHKTNVSNTPNFNCTVVVFIAWIVNIAAEKQFGWVQFGIEKRDRDGTFSMALLTNLTLFAVLHPPGPHLYTAFRQGKKRKEKKQNGKDYRLQFNSRKVVPVVVVVHSFFQ